ncbi:hypothetical protein AVEN_167040-1 [Araneus ventricosus]|uniref:Uncharacterized protein n=1 Tax=Araneus ventricosus TaxID=182803 RepID=A0A4Y2SIU8_ARAVE|nr:hypothetical protein AVEN_167040-1 [Araneus ventricosus]
MNGIICENHLHEVYGLHLENRRLTDKIEISYVGPYITVKEYFDFSENEVILPTKDFFDKHFRPDKHPHQANEGHFIMNTMIDTFVNKLIYDMKDDNRAASRYQLEVIRNLAVPKMKDVTIGTDQKIAENFENFNITLRNRINAMNEAINSSRNHMLFENNTLVLDDGTKKSTQNDEEISPFYKFLISHCFFDIHKTPVKSVVETLNPNVTFNANIGLYTLEFIPNPIPLVVCGNQLGNHKFYYLISTSYKMETKPVPMSPKKLPHQMTVRGRLVGASKDCYF